MADRAVEDQLVPEAPRVTILPTADPESVTACGQIGDVHTLEAALGRVELDIACHAVHFDEGSTAPGMGPEENEEIAAVEVDGQRGPVASLRETPGECLVQRDNLPVALVQDAWRLVMEAHVHVPARSVVVPPPRHDDEARREFRLIEEERRPRARERGVLDPLVQPVVQGAIATLRNQDLESRV